MALEIWDAPDRRGVSSNFLGAVPEERHAAPGLLTLLAVLVGRACHWALAAIGQADVENALDHPRSGIDSALLGFCRSSVAVLTRDDLLTPDGLRRALGAVR